MIVFLGPIGLVAYLTVKRRQYCQDSWIPATRALSATLWIATVTMIGFVVVEQINFVTVFPWRIKLLLYYFVPQIFAGVALQFSRLVDRYKGVDKPRSASFFLVYFFSSTLVTLCAHIIVDFMGRLALHITFPFYNPLWWYAVMCTSILIVMAVYLPHLWLDKLGVPLWGMPAFQPEPSPEGLPVFQWYKALVLLLGSYLALFMVQAYFITTSTPNYVAFSDAIRMILGIDLTG
jgi:hypothetical protein